MQIQLKCTSPQHEGDNPTLGTIELPDAAPVERIESVTQGVICNVCRDRDAAIDATPSAREQLDAMWDAMSRALSLEQRAQLRIMKIAVVDALDSGAYDEAAALIQSQPVPPQFEAVKSQAIALLEGAQG